MWKSGLEYFRLATAMMALGRFGPHLSTTRSGTSASPKKFNDHVLGLALPDAVLARHDDHGICMRFHHNRGNRRMWSVCRMSFSQISRSLSRGGGAGARVLSGAIATRAF